MLKLWNLLDKKFCSVDGYVLLIAKPLFWWMYAEGYLDSPARRKSFTRFFELEEKHG